MTALTKHNTQINAIARWGPGLRWGRGYAAAGSGGTVKENSFSLWRIDCDELWVIHLENPFHNSARSNYDNVCACVCMCVVVCVHTRSQRHDDDDDDGELVILVCRMCPTEGFSAVVSLSSDVEYTHTNTTIHTYLIYHNALMRTYT